jgi:uncharacterized protein YndB with AHSA1/START domain
MKKLFRLLVPGLLFLRPAVAEERAIEREITVAAGLTEVWSAWTTNDGIRSFLAPDAQVELRVGGPFEIYFDPFANPGMRGADDMVIMAFQEQKMLSFTWNAPPHLPEARRQRTHVLVRLSAINATETRVTLRHDGWGEGGEWDQAFDYFSRAWTNVMASLQKRFAEGPVDWSDWLKQLREHHAKQDKP